MRKGRGEGRGALNCSDCIEVLHLKVAMQVASNKAGVLLEQHL